MKHFYAIVIVFLLIPSISFSQDNCNGNWLSTEGNRLIDANGNTVRLTGINWFGFETETNFPHGLWGVRDHRSMLQQIKDLGFNTIRVPWHNGMLDNGASLNVVGGGTDPYTGASPMNEIESTFTQPIQLLDFMIEWCQENDMKIVLDCHSRNPDAFIEENLWYTDNVSEEQWIEDWVFIADRYKSFDAVIGMDINNEPHGNLSDPTGAKWGNNDNSNDWRLAAQRCGNAILEANPNVLIIVEGIQAYQKPNGEQTNYWWGGNLQGARDFPVVLSNPSKLMYSPHEYGPTVSEQPWFFEADFPNNLEGIWEEQFNFLNTNNESPLLVGEFGIRDQGSLDEIWFEEFTDYIIEKGLSYTYWCFNPNSGDTGGILADDWITVNQWKMDYLTPTLFETIPNCMPAQDQMCQLNISCVEDMTISLTSNGCTATNVDLEAPTTNSCQGESLTNNAPSEFPLGVTTVTWTLEDAEGNTITCTQNITIIDQIAPEMSCLDDMEVTINENSTFTIPNFTTSLTIQDNCDTSNLSIVQTPNAGTVLSAGSYEVIIQAIDTSGNTNNCSFDLLIDEAAMCQLSINCIEDMTISLTANNCVATNVNLGTPSTNSCNNASLTNDAPSEFPLGVTTVTWTLEDEDGNAITCTQNITIIDQIAPEISCLENIEVVIDQNTTYTLPNYIADISVTDNCNNANLTITQTPIASTELTTGSYDITIEATDASGNSNNCNFNLIVDNTLSINDVLIDSNNISLYPNPVGDILTIEQSQALPLQIELYDLIGRKVINTSINSSSIQTIDVSQLKTALYIVRIQSDTNVITRKVVVNH